jgi:hypothetical protein
MLMSSAPLHRRRLLNNHPDADQEKSFIKYEALLALKLCSDH